MCFKNEAFQRKVTDFIKENDEIFKNEENEANSNAHEI